MFKTDRKKFAEGQIYSLTATYLPLPHIINSNQKIFQDFGFDLVYLGRGIVDQRKSNLIRKILQKEIKIEITDSNLIYLPTLDYDISPITPEPVENEKELCEKLKDNLTAIPDVSFEYNNKIHNTEFRGYDIRYITHLKDFLYNYVYAHDYSVSEKRGHLEDLTHKSVEIYRNPAPIDSKLFQKTVSKKDEIAQETADENGRLKVRTKETFIKENSDLIQFVAQKLDIEPLEPVINRIPDAQKYYPYLF